MTYAKSLGLYYLYDVNGDGIVNTKDINQLKLAQTATDYHLDGWNINNKLMGG